MTNDVSVNTHRLKYKNQYVEVKLSYNDSGLVNVEVTAPVTSFEKTSFYKITTLISKLVYSGIRNRASILGKMEKLGGIDYDVLEFMKKVVKTHLPLE